MLYHYPYYAVFGVGWIGVDLFFVLSGFLISGLLFSEWSSSGAISVGRFYFRRGFKIYPAFYFFLFTATWAYAAVQQGFWQHPISTLRNEVFFLQDYLPHIWPHTWSLAVEEQFYLLLPLLLILIARLYPGKRPFALVPVLVIASLIVCLGISNHETSALTRGCKVGFPLPCRRFVCRRRTRLPVPLGYLFHFQKALFLRWSRSWLLPVAIALLLPAAFCTTARYAPWVLTGNVLAFSALVLWTVPRHAPVWMRKPWSASASIRIRFICGMLSWLLYFAPISLITSSGSYRIWQPA